MAGTTTSSRINSGHAGGTAMDTVIQFNKAVDDLALDVPLQVTTATVGNATTTETDLETYTIPASKLASANDIILFKAWGTTANNANAKTLKVYFNGSAVHSVSLTISQAGRWLAEFQITKTGSNAQNWFSQVYEQTATNAAGKGAMDVGTATATDTGTIVVKVTGTATSNNDITASGSLVTFIPTAAELTAAKIGNQAGTAITAGI